MLGVRLKQAVNQSRLTAEEAAEGLGVSKANLYLLYKKDSFDVDYVRRASTLLDLPVSYFLDESTPSKVEKVSKPGGFDNLMLQELREDIRLLREQLSTKDRQIEKLLDLLGKLERAIMEPLSAEAGEFDVDMCRYVITVIRTVGLKQFLQATPLLVS